jgi:uncharacterized RDD family membrane protein YckC
VELSRYGARVGAFFVDLVILFGIGFAAGVIVGIVFAAGGGSPADNRDALRVVSFVVGIGISIGYPAVLLSRKGAHNGQTWGKQATGIRVVRDDGQPMSVGRALLRQAVGQQLLALATLYLYLIVDYLWPMGDRENQALHDKIASTHVVVTRPAAAPAVGAPLTPPPPAATAPPPASPPSAIPPPAPPPPPEQTYGGFAPPSASPDEPADSQRDVDS